MSKFEKYKQILPKLYSNPLNKKNGMLRGLIQAWADSDDYTVEQIRAGKANLFVKTADNNNLHKIAYSLGIKKDQEYNLNVNIFRKIIPKLSLEPKLTKGAIYGLIESLYGKDMTHSVVRLVIKAGQNLKVQNKKLKSIGDTFTATVDGVSQTVTVIENDFVDGDNIETLFRTLSRLNNLKVEKTDSEVKVYSLARAFSGRFTLVLNSNAVKVNNTEELLTPGNNTYIAQFQTKPTRCAIVKSGKKEVTIEIPAYASFSYFDKPTYFSDRELTNKKRLEGLVNKEELTAAKALEVPDDTGHIRGRNQTSFEYFDKEVYLTQTLYQKDTSFFRVVNKPRNEKIDGEGLPPGFRGAITHVVLEEIPAGKYDPKTVRRKSLLVKQVAQEYVELESAFDFSGSNSFLAGIKGATTPLKDNPATLLENEAEEVTTAYTLLRYKYDSEKISKSAESGDLLKNQQLGAPIYLISSTQDRIFAQQVIRDIIATGVKVNFVLKTENIPK